ncbi:UNVERIFIED_CONTAM: hypothetical protein GTU68_054092 [Idotea baltica]|nr:hypothetical protein [Idotea baltica]
MQTKWQFSKMHGIGNDYVYFDCTKNEFPNPEFYSKKISNRNFGIGSDGIILILSSKTADFRMRMYNPDGSEAEMCGNGVRCVAKYVYEKGLTNKKLINLETMAGLIILELNIENNIVNSVRVNLGNPILEPKGNEIKIDKFTGLFTAVSMGNPHAVFFVDKLTDDLIKNIAPKIEIHKFFPNKVNVEFVEVVSRDRVKMRVWERNTGETLACGTGAGAVCVAGALNNLTNNKITIELLGGDLELEWKENEGVYKTGPAEFSFEGKIDLAQFDEL